MIEQINKKVLNLLEAPYNISLIILTFAFYVVLTNSYYGINFDIIKILFTYKVYFCGAAFLLSITNGSIADAARKEAAQVNILTMMLAIISLILFGSVIVHRVIAMFMVVITIFMFLFSVKKLYLLVK